MVGVDVSCSGFMEAGSRRSLGLRPTANPMGVLPLEGHLCISHRCCLAHQVGRSDLCQSGLVQVVGGCIHESQEKLLEQSYTHLSSVWPWCMRSFRKSLHVVHSVECLHVVRMVESHICTNRLRVHLERVYPLMNFSNYFRCGSIFCMHRLSNVMWLHPRQSEIRMFCLQSLPIHGPER